MSVDLSAALIAYLWNRAGYPGKNFESLVAAVGSEQAGAVRPRLDELVEEAFDCVDAATMPDLQEIGAQVRATMRERHAELSADATKALAGLVTYTYR